MLRSLFLLVTLFAALPAWHSCRGQDAVAGEALESTQQPGQVSSQKPVAAPPSTNPSSQQTTPLPTNTTSPRSTLDDTVDAGEIDRDMSARPRKMTRWNEYTGPHFTANAGMGFLVDTASYAQDDTSRRRTDHGVPGPKTRDFRFVLGGSFASLPRKVTYNLGIMYDAPSHSWLIRQTGIMVAVPDCGATLHRPLQGRFLPEQGDRRL